MKASTPITVPHWKLRRVAQRAIAVQKRHHDASAAIQQFDKTLEPTVTRFVNLFDASRAGSPAALELAEGHKAVSELRLVMRGWLSLVARDIAGFNAQSFDDRPLVPDDVIGSAQRLLEVVRTFKRDGEPLAYVAQVEESLGGAIDKALKAWSDAQEHLTAHQALLAETREAAVALHKELIALRRALRVVLGMQHRDYRTLRTVRSAAKDDADEATSEVGDGDSESANGGLREHGIDAHRAVARGRGRLGDGSSCAKGRMNEEPGPASAAWSGANQAPPLTN